MISSPFSSTSETLPSRSQQIAQVTNMLQSAAAASERVFEFLEEEEEEQTVEHPVTLENGVEGHVTFEHVSFGY